MKKLPLGTHTFKDIIEKENVYVDKTEYIFKLIDSTNKYFFLSRPRRFGKSLLISTLEEIFLGNKELFKDLWIYDKYDFKKYPIIRIDFSRLDLLTPERFEKSLSLTILDIAKKYNINLYENDSYKHNFLLLIEELAKTEKVIILVDEYDKPIVDFVENLEIVKQNRAILKNFYVTLKACDEYIKFAFLTGVSKFSKVSVFSGLNNLRDITLEENFSTMLGYTQDELFSYFDEHIKDLSDKLGKTEEQIKQELRNWYNGYSWDGKNFLYNPFSILNVLTSQQINNYWFESGTPTFLIKLIKDKNVNVEKLENYVSTRELLDSFEIENIKVESLLFQTGYLTIKRIDDYGEGDRDYILNYPNMEVKESLIKNIIGNFLYDRDKEVLAGQLYRSLKNNDLKLFFDKLKKIFTDIPNEIFMSDKERYYHTIIYLVLTLIGIRIDVEVSTNLGRIDAVIKTKENIYIFEFKMSSINQAIKQIETKKYYEKYLLENRTIYLVGVSFDSKERNIRDWKAEIVK